MLVAITFTPGTTAPAGSVTTPEIEPVMAAHAATVPKIATETSPIKDTNLTKRFIWMTSQKRNTTEIMGLGRLSNAGASNDDEVTVDPL
jgi:hypothetical protein